MVHEDARNDVAMFMLHNVPSSEREFDSVLLLLFFG